MTLLVFGSRNLGARHLRALTSVLSRVAETVGQDVKLVLVHGDGPPGTQPGAIGADKLSEAAASMAWEGRPRSVRRFPANWKQEGADAGPRRNRRMAQETPKPYRAICFHMDPELGQGSKGMAYELRRAGVPYLLVLLGAQGEIIREEER